LCTTQCFAQDDLPLRIDTVQLENRGPFAVRAYGHTYVVFGQVDKDGNMVDPEVASLAPASPDAVGHFLPVSTIATTGSAKSRATWATRRPASGSDHNSSLQIFER
jgi:hypothetical protein